jgi:hypothetical protein
VARRIPPVTPAAIAIALPAEAMTPNYGTTVR